MASGIPEVEEQESTRIEKVLLFALVAFLLVGGFWALSRIEGNFPRPELQSYGYSNGYGYEYANRDDRPSVEDELGVTPLRSEVQQLQGVLDNRKAAQSNARASQQKALAAYEFRREEYRTAIEAGRAAEDLKPAFESARAAYQQATTAVAMAQKAQDFAAKRLKDRQRELDARAAHAQDVFDSRLFQRNIRLFAFHFSFAAACLGLSWILWQFGRGRRWRYQTILTAFFTASILQLLFLLFRYCWELFLEDYAALGISLLGTVVCILAIVGIKRWLFSPERLAQARLAGHRCAMCSTPFTETQTHCWHCGKPLVESCHACGANRLLYTPHCGNCGAGTTP